MQGAAEEVTTGTGAASHRHASGWSLAPASTTTPKATTRKPARAATVGEVVNVARAPYKALGRTLRATPFASSDIITRYQPFDRDHNGQPLLTRQEHVVADQRWICRRTVTTSLVFSNLCVVLEGVRLYDNGGPYNAEVCHQDRMNHIYLRVIPGQVILPGREIFLNYGTGRSVAMGNSRH